MRLSRICVQAVIVCSIITPQLLVVHGGSCPLYLRKAGCDVRNDVVELLVGLALAVAHRQLRVDERRAGGHLEGARLGASAVGAGRAVNALRDGDLARILLLEEGGQRGGVLGVPSAASVLDADPELRHGGKGSPDRGGKKRDDLLAGCVLRGCYAEFRARAARGGGQ